MLPLLLVGAGVYLWHRHKTVRVQQSTKPAPRLLAAHSHLMSGEWNPDKLERAASHFRSQGLPAQAADLKGKAAQVKAQLAAIPDVCKRARALDENAMAMLAGIRDNAAKGDVRAQFSAHAIENWCRNNPAPELGPTGEAAAA
jgi:hypothetical protein